MHCRFLIVLVIAICPLAAIAGGCGRSGPASEASDPASDARLAGKLGGVAVVDMDEVAKQLGSDVALLQEINAGQASLNKQLQSLQSSLQDKYQRKKQELEIRPVTEGAKQEPRKQQLTEFEQELNLQLNKARDTAQNELNNYRQQLVQRFRAEVAPAAQEAAAERGLGVVVTKNDTVLLAFDDAHNITTAVVAKLRAQRAAARESRSAAAVNRSDPSTTQRR
jgi:Skp family chaperone for outer membrane proteins